MIVQILMSVLLGMLPEVLYFTLFLKYTKNLQEKTAKLGFLIGIAYILCMFIQRYQEIYYIVFIALTYGILKLLYKNKAQIIDVFIIAVAAIYITLVSAFCFSFVNNNLILYYIMAIISKICLFVPFIFKRYFNKLYKAYYGLWNRKYNETHKIKSITLRNISLIVLNILICVIGFLCLHITNII